MILNRKSLFYCCECVVVDRRSSSVLIDCDSLEKADASTSFARRTLQYFCRLLRRLVRDDLDELLACLPQVSRLEWYHWFQ
jgi:hypothetical protein